MNAPVPLSISKSASMVFHVVGRVEHVAKYQDTVTTLIKTPAPDAYSHPSTIAVRSRARLGAIGDEIEIDCRVGGVPRTFSRTDKGTGEVTPVRTADHFFNVVE